MASGSSALSADGVLSSAVEPPDGPNAKSSQRFVKRYNLRAREKRFETGDLVLWLTP